jgi:hypothetical protein
MRLFLFSKKEDEWKGIEKKLKARNVLCHFSVLFRLSFREDTECTVLPKTGENLCHIPGSPTLQGGKTNFGFYNRPRIYWLPEPMPAPQECFCFMEFIVMNRGSYFYKVEGKAIPVAARSKACVYGRSLTGIVGSNPAEGMDVCLL